MSTRIHQLYIPFFFLLLALSYVTPAIGQHVQEKIKNGLFIENKGQWKESVLYKSELPSGQLYIEKDRFVFNFWDKEAASRHHGHNHSSSGETQHSANQKAIAPGDVTPTKPDLIKAHAYEVRFLNSTTPTASSGQNPTNYQFNYFKGADQSKWASNVNGYQSTLIENIYPGTHLKCYGKETCFKYEFHLRSGADASLISLQYVGADSIYIRNGELMLQTSVNTIIEQKPFSYQIIDGSNIEVPCKFSLKDSTVTFSFPKGYNKNYPLIIDPELVFSTYSGSESDNWGNTATYDDDGNAYMVGIAFGAQYPVTTGAYQLTYRGNYEEVYYNDFNGTYKYDPDLAIMKFGPTGTLLYATYLGGNETEVPSSIIVNKQHQLVILGFTGSDGGRIWNSTVNGLPFPTTTGAYDRTFNGGVGTSPSGPGGPLGRYDGIFFDRGSDLFVAILNETGSSLVASTFIGGSANDGLTFRERPPAIGPMARNYGDQFRSEILCDEDDNIYIVTKTNSSDIINTAVPGYDQTFNGALDGYVCKMSPMLDAMIWNTYIGGSGQDAGYSIRIAADKSVYVCGGTTSTNFPLVSPIKSSLTFGDTDGFISHFSADGSTLINSTYIGTSSYDQTFFIQLDTEENVYVFGQTLGNYPITPGAYGIPNTGQFIQKLSPDLSTSLMSTTFGNVQNRVSIVPTAFLINDCGNIMLSGWGGSVNAQIEQDGGFPYANIVTGYLGGNTFDLPLTSDAYQKTTDGSDFYLMVLQKDATALLYATYFGGGNGERDHVDGGTSRFDKRGIIYQSVCASCGGTSHFPTTPGALSTTNNSDNCNNAIFKFDLTNIKAAFDVDTTKGCPGMLVNIMNKSIGKNMQWDFGDGTGSDEFNPPPHRYTKPGTYIIRLIVTDLTTCIGRDTAEKTITVYPLPPISIGVKDTTICKKDTIQILRSCNPYWTYQWSPSQYAINTSQCEALFFPPVKTQYIVTVTDTNFCVQRDSVTIHVAEIVKGIDWQNLTTCKGKPTIQFRNPSAGPLNYIWTFGDGTSSTEAVPTHVFESGGHYTIHLSLSNRACSDTDVLPIDLEEVMIPNLITKNNDGKNDCFEIKGLYEGWTVEIYNAWSKRVFLNENYANDFCGENLNPSVYYYLVCAPHGDCCKSWVQIIY